MNSNRRVGSLLSRLRIAILAVLVASSVGLLIFVSDNYIIHNPYAFGRSCISCYDYVYYVYDFAYKYANPGVFAAAFFLVLLVCLILLWTPGKGFAVALSRTFLVVAPALLFIFEIGVYLWLNYAWRVHATDFLAGTPFTNEVIFWVSGCVLVVGVVVQVAQRRR